MYLRRLRGAYEILLRRCAEIPGVTDVIRAGEWGRPFLVVYAVEPALAHLQVPVHVLGVPVRLRRTQGLELVED